MYMIAEVSQYVAVASFTEAWIEILRNYRKQVWILVASFTEAWIEIVSVFSDVSTASSPPSRRRGLKWTSRKHIFSIRCRLLHGGVD